MSHQKKYGIDRAGKDPPEGVAETSSTHKRAHRALELSGCPHDLRMDDAGNVWVLEANPNPQIARGEDFTDSAEKAGIGYETVLQRILNLGLKWQPESVA